MELLIAGLILFIGVHLIPTIGGLRAALITKLGEMGYKGVFALASLAGLVLIVMGKGAADFVALYEPPGWAMHLTGTMMLLAVACMVSFLLNSSLRRLTAHPMLWGVSFWAIGHLVANGDLASVMLFASLLIYAQIAMISGNMRGARPSTSGASLMQNGIALVVAALLYGALMMFHAYFTGISLMA